MLYTSERENEFSEDSDFKVYEEWFYMNYNNDKQNNNSTD